MVKAYHKLLNSEDDDVRYVEDIEVAMPTITHLSVGQSPGCESLV